MAEEAGDGMDGEAGTGGAAGAAGGRALSEMAGRIVSWAHAGEEVEAYVARGRDTSVRVFGGEIESLSSAESAGVGIRVVLGARQGFAYAGSLDEDILAETLAEARDNAAFATPDEHVGLANPDGVEAAALDLWRPSLDGLTAEDKVALALELEAQVRAGDPRIRQVEQANWGDVSTEMAVATTTGISACSRRTSCYVSAYAIAGEGGETQTGGGYSVGREPGDIELAKAADDAVRRSTELLGARQARSGRLTVVLDRRVTTTLLSILAGTLSGEAVLKGRSPFADRLGDTVGTAGLTLVDDPTDVRAYGAAVHDAEGLACRRNVLISEGVVGAFLYDSYSGRRAGTASTASAVRGGFKTTPGVGARALALVPGVSDEAQIVAQVGEGLMVRSITGVHSGVNPISGDFSVGAEGLMIRGGALAEPVREVTIASTIQRMLQTVVAIGGDVEWLPGSAAGVTLAIADISMSGS
ncbi:MAG: hypothetical protein DLM54_12475 [Acidimicrobiales bacterium]|nr:MAG: hypothetical protein DLM54_12475 [Acidimicrobiales bacterium]